MSKRCALYIVIDVTDNIVAALNGPDGEQKDTAKEVFLKEFEEGKAELTKYVVESFEDLKPKLIWKDI